MKFSDVDWDRPQAFSVEQWEWAIVQIDEILRLTEFADQAHDRLALILLDQLAELIMDREIDTLFAEQMADAVAQEMIDIENRNGYPMHEHLAFFVKQHIWADERNEIDLHFHSKTRYLRRIQWMTESEQVAIQRLHEYRNEAYHRGRLDADLVNDLVLVYGNLVGDLLTRHRPLAYPMGLFSTHLDESRFLDHPSDLGRRLSGSLEPDLQQLARRLSVHVKDRVQTIKEGHLVASLAHSHEAGARSVSHPDAEGMAPEWLWQLLQDIVKVPFKRILSWEKRVEKLRSRPATLTQLLIRYINLDRDLKDLEPHIRKWSAVRDSLEEAEEDRRRGK